MKEGKTMKKGLKIVIGAVVILLVAAAIFAFYVVKSSQDKLAAMENVDIDMEKVADGVYAGSSEAGIVKVKVQVEVKDHKIVSIDLVRHANGRGKPAEAELDDMIANNTDNVDVVSGATVSGETIRNAVNMALRQGLTENAG